MSHWINTLSASGPDRCVIIRYDPGVSLWSAAMIYCEIQLLVWITIMEIWNKIDSIICFIARRMQGLFCVCEQPRRDGVIYCNAVSHWLLAYTEWSLVWVMQISLNHQLANKANLRNSIVATLYPLTSFLYNGVQYQQYISSRTYNNIYHHGLMTPWYHICVCINWIILT